MIEPMDTSNINRLSVSFEESLFLTGLAEKLNEVIKLLNELEKDRISRHGRERIRGR